MAIIGNIPTIDPEAGELGESTLVDRPDAIGGLNQASDGAVGKAAERCEIVRVVPRAKHESWQ